MIKDERELMSMLYGELNTRHANELRILKSTSYKDLLKHEIYKEINKTDPLEVSHSKYWTFVYDNLLYGGMLRTYGGDLPAQYTFGDNIYTLNEEQLLILLNLLSDTHAAQVYDGVGMGL